MKLPSSVRVQTKQFDPETYKIEDQIQFINDHGNQQTSICPVDNIIRWRYTKKNDVKEENVKKENKNISS